MLEERRELLLRSQARAKITEQIELAREPWSDARKTLSAYPEVVTILDDLYCHVLPYLIKGYENSAIHHIAHVVNFMARIGTSELPRHDVKRGVIAALLHDIGSGDSFLPKVTEEMIKKAPKAKQDHLRIEGVKYRREHMDKGVEISRGLLETYQLQHPHALTDTDLQAILDIVGTHDDCKIPLMEKKVKKKWLLRAGEADWLKQCHWEADALWMLCPDGILIDLEREREEDTADNRRAKFRFNLRLHGEIVKVYRKAYSKRDFDRFRFRGKLLYRTKTGYRMAMRFKRDVKAP